MRPAPQKNLSETQRRFLLLVLFITGAVALIIEIVGTRVISPYYGQSLYSWSALITVTLIALAGGYSLGGRQADRNPNLTLLSRTLSLAGAAAALIPLLKNPVLKFTSPLGIQIGALASATFLMAPTLVLLGALGPLAVKLTTSEISSVGKSAGDVYALSTMGSVFGAALAGFALIPHLAISHIFYGISCLLLGLGAWGSYLSQLKIPLPTLSAAAAVLAWGFWPRALPDINVLFNKDSPYGQIKVVDFDGKRYLLVNGTTQSMADIGTMETDSQYIQGVQWAALLRPKTRKALVIGVGAGLLPGILEKNYHLSVDTVDIDPEIVQTAKTYFNFSPRGRIFLEDGRTYLERTQNRYGLIILDAFGSETPPYHLFTQEAFQAMKSRLEPDGILAINLVTLVHGPGLKPWESAYKTLIQVFPEVRAFLAGETYEDIGNVLFFCSNAPLEGHPSKTGPGARTQLKYMLAHELKVPQPHLAQAIAMTDDHAPMEYLLAQTCLRWRSQLQRKIPEILLY